MITVQPCTLLSVNIYIYIKLLSLDVIRHYSADRGWFGGVLKPPTGGKNIAKACYIKM